MHKFTLIKQFNNKLVKLNFDTELFKFKVNSNHKNPVYRNKAELLKSLGAIEGETVLLYKE